MLTYIFLFSHVLTWNVAWKVFAINLYHTFHYIQATLILETISLQSLYADFCGCMLMTAESIADLQTRVSSKIAAEDFRPNILIEGTKKPYDEDEWQYVKIGDTVFRNIAPCSRYAMFLKQLDFPKCLQCDTSCFERHVVEVSIETVLEKKMFWGAVLL